MNIFQLFSDIENVDADASDKLSYYSRRYFLRKGTKAATAVALPVALASITQEAFAQSTEVQEVLNFALKLEYLEEDFYQRALSQATFDFGADRPVFEQIHKHEASHVKLLQTALGTAAAPKPALKYDAFPDVFSNYQTFLIVAQAFEDTGVRAYKGQAPKLYKLPELTTALQIHAVEARHAAEVRRLREGRVWVTKNESDGAPAAVYAGEENTVQKVDVRTLGPGFSDIVVTEAFDEPLTKEAVLAIVQPFGVV